MKVTFSVNQYDHEGDVYEEGVYLHFDGGFIITLSSVDELDKMIENLQDIRNEIKENY